MLPPNFSNHTIIPNPICIKSYHWIPPQELHLGDVSSDDEWIVEENGTPNDDVNVIEDDTDDVPPLEEIEEYLKNLDGEENGDDEEYYQFAD
ncbi:hypothetical protein A2U01_0024773 [Trifolium medium]|uniref:Uncharacterized protein n=1 Tax=Trifolium medium TaxID=97028 RepID=A0A392NWB8_9FABA|nr:hypothetical protein [Trifolium medium]